MSPKLLLPGVPLVAIALILCGLAFGPIEASGAGSVENFVDSRDVVYAKLQESLDVGPEGCRRTFPTGIIVVQPRLRSRSIVEIHSDLDQGHVWKNTRRLIVIYEPTDEENRKKACLDSVGDFLDGVERQLTDADFRPIPTKATDCQEDCLRLGLLRNGPGRISVEIDCRWEAAEEQCLVDLFIDESFGGS